MTTFSKCERINRYVLIRKPSPAFRACRHGVGVCLNVHNCSTKHAREYYRTVGLWLGLFNGARGDDNISHHDGLIALNNVHEERVELLITLRWDVNCVLLSLSAIYQHVFGVVRRLCVWIRVRLEAEPNVSRCSRRRCEGNAATFWERERVDAGIVVSKACPLLRTCWEGVGLCFSVYNRT